MKISIRIGYSKRAMSGCGRGNENSCGIGNKNG